MKNLLFPLLMNLLILPPAVAGSYLQPIDNFSQPFHPEAFIQFSNDVSGDARIFLADPQGNPQKQPFLSVPGMENLNHEVEYHHGHLYCMENLGKRGTDTELWKYEGRQGTKLMAGAFSGPFLVSPDETYIALVVLEETGFGYRLDILDAKDLKPLKTFSSQDLGLNTPNENYNPISLISFYNGELWVCGGKGGEEPIQHFVEIEEGTWKKTPYPCARETDEVQVFNPYSRLLAFDDYPIFPDAAVDEEFQAAKTVVHLKVYDVRKGKIIPVDSGPAWRFGEKWVGEETLEYKNPHGVGVIQKKFSPMGN